MLSGKYLNFHQKYIVRSNFIKELINNTSKCGDENLLDVLLSEHTIR